MKTQSTITKLSLSLRRNALAVRAFVVDSLRSCIVSPSPMSKPFARIDALTTLATGNGHEGQNARKDRQYGWTATRIGSGMAM